jgi:preprotein translocase subunit SecB
MAKKTIKINSESVLSKLRLTLLNLRLVGSESRVGEIRQDQLPSVANQNVDFDIAMKPDLTKAIVRTGFILSVYYETPQADDTPPAIYVEAHYEIAYDLEGSSEKLSDKIAHRVQVTAAMNLWPFWREFVQSMTNRMGLPAFPVPLLYANTDLPKKIQAKKTTTKLNPKTTKD